MAWNSVNENNQVTFTYEFTENDITTSYIEYFEYDEANGPAFNGKWLKSEWSDTTGNSGSYSVTFDSDTNTYQTIDIWTENAGQDVFKSILNYDSSWNFLGGTEIRNGETTEYNSDWTIKSQTADTTDMTQITDTTSTEYKLFGDAYKVETNSWESGKEYTYYDADGNKLGTSYFDEYTWEDWQGNKITSTNLSFNDEDWNWLGSEWSDSNGNKGTNYSEIIADASVDLDGDGSIDVSGTDVRKESGTNTWTWDGNTESSEYTWYYDSSWNFLGGIEVRNGETVAYGSDWTILSQTKEVIGLSELTDTTVTAYKLFDDGDASTKLYYSVTDNSWDDGKQYAYYDEAGNKLGTAYYYEYTWEDWQGNDITNKDMSFNDENGEWLGSEWSDSNGNSGTNFRTEKEVSYDWDFDSTNADTTQLVIVETSKNISIWDGNTNTTESTRYFNPENWEFLGGEDIIDGNKIVYDNNWNIISGGETLPNNGGTNDIVGINLQNDNLYVMFEAQVDQSYLPIAENLSLIVNDNIQEGVIFNPEMGNSNVIIIRLSNVSINEGDTIYLNDLEDSYSVYNQTVVNDSTAPEIQEIVHDGSTVTITINEPVNTFESSNQFYITDSKGKVLTFNSGYSVNSNGQITLTLDENISLSEVLTLTYTDATVEDDIIAIQDFSGNDMDTVTVSNITDTTGTITFDQPITQNNNMKYFTLMNNNLYISFENTLQDGDIPTADELTLSINDTPITATLLVEPRGSNSITVRISSDTTIQPEDVVSLNYLEQDYSVKNWTMIDDIAPQISNVVHDGTTITITLDDFLNVYESSNNFVVKDSLGTQLSYYVSGKSTSDAGGGDITLTLNEAISLDEVLSLTYTDVTPEDDIFAIQDWAGNDMATVTIGNITSSTFPTIIKEAGNTYLYDGIGDNFANQLYGYVNYVDVSTIDSEIKLEYFDLNNNYLGYSVEFISASYNTTISGIEYLVNNYHTNYYDNTDLQIGYENNSFYDNDSKPNQSSGGIAEYDADTDLLIKYSTEGINYNSDELTYSYKGNSYKVYDGQNNPIDTINMNVYNSGDIHATTSNLGSIYYYSDNTSGLNIYDGNSLYSYNLDQDNSQLGTDFGILDGSTLGSVFVHVDTESYVFNIDGLTSASSLKGALEKDTITSVTNTDSSDGIIDVIFNELVTIHLTGISKTNDSDITDVTSFQTIFG